MPKIRHVLLTGPPGIGKTTLARKVCDALLSRGVALTGFYTEEVRTAAGSGRIGFDVVRLPSNERRPLARKEAGGERRGPMVGQYVVDIPSFEAAALPALEGALTQQGGVLVVDEVGKMELLSSRFTPALERALQVPAAPAMLATLPAPPRPGARPLPAVEKLRERADARLVTVDRANRDDPTLLQEILAILTSK